MTIAFKHVHIVITATEAIPTLLSPPFFSNAGELGEYTLIHNKKPYQGENAWKHEETVM